MIATRNEAHVAQTASLVAAIVYEISPPVRWTEGTLPFSEDQFEKPRGVLAASHDPSLESKHAAPSKYFPGSIIDMEMACTITPVPPHMQYQG